MLVNVPAEITTNKNTSAIKSNKANNRTVELLA